MIQQIQDFLYIHPWWHAFVGSFLVAIPSLLAVYFSLKDGRDMAEANRLRGEVSKATSRIAELQEERNCLEGEKRDALEKIAKHTERPLTEGERNAIRLRKHIGQYASITEGANRWGGTVQIAAIDEDNILTLFTPAGFNSGTAWAQQVKCDNLEFVVEASGQLQIKILKRYGTTQHLGDIKEWRHRGQGSSKARPYGSVLYNISYRYPESSRMRNLFVYDQTNGNPDYTLVVRDGDETDTFYGDAMEISKKLALLRVECISKSCQFAGAGNSSAGKLFLL